MIKIAQVLPNSFCKELIKSTISGIKDKNCYYDQLHYVNRRFIASNYDFISEIVASNLQNIMPGLKSSDLVYVNDFVAPVNLENAQIHTKDKSNKYGWHIDGIDRSIGPCFNLWIPFYRKAALRNLNNQSLFNVIERGNSPLLYKENGDPRANAIVYPEELHPVNIDLTTRYLGISRKNLMENVILPCLNGRIEIVSKDSLVQTEVVKPKLGDGFIFASNQYHASGASSLERIGISIKFLVSNRKFGFRHLLNEDRSGSLPLSNWLGLFLGCYDQFGDFKSYENFIDDCILGEQFALNTNQLKLDSIRYVLEEIFSEM
jgi:hypothetical protein